MPPGTEMPAATTLTKKKRTMSAEARARISAAQKKRWRVQREVKRLLTEGGFRWERFGNPMAAIHTVLKRLVHQQEAVTLIDGLGERRFVVKRGTVIALERQDIEDRTFIRKFLEAESQEDVVELVKQRRTEPL